MVTERENIGAILKNSPALHSLEHRVVFNINETAFFQRLISREVLERLRVKPVDYLKSLIFLEYFTKVLDNNYAVCDNLETLSKSLREREKAKGDTLGEKGEEGASYLNLETVVFETGIFAKEMQIRDGKYRFTKKETQEMERRYNQERDIDLENARKVDCFYEGDGEMVCNQVSSKMKPFLKAAKKRADIGAIVFADSVLGVIEDKTKEKDIYEQLAKGEYYCASLLALKGLIEGSSLDKLKQAFEKNA